MTRSFGERRADLTRGAKRIVIKVGSGLLTGAGHTEVDETVIAMIAGQAAELVRTGCKIAVVSSGSVAIGSRLLNVNRKGMSIPQRQAAAALGQGSLIAMWAKYFGEEGFKVGQVLLTHDDLKNRRRFLNSRNTINTLLDFGLVPIINENDTVAVHEIKFGDNDALSARVTNLMEADLLAILSDVDGLFTADPRLTPDAGKIDYVEDVDDSILEMAGDSSSMTGLGGMSSKVQAAATAGKFGAPTVIVPGTVPGILKKALGSDPVGTFFFPHKDQLSSKKHWIEFILKPEGEVHIDQGAREAVKLKGKSLLALGITRVVGEFESGEAVNIFGPDGELVAKGLVNYHSHELVRISGKHSGLIEETLGYKVYDEIVHRNDMVFFT